MVEWKMQPGKMYKMTEKYWCNIKKIVKTNKRELTFRQKFDMLNMLGGLDRAVFFALYLAKKRCYTKAT